MKTACGVIRDLLPLYTEKMTGEESNALIREHLDECKACSDYLHNLEHPIDNDITNTASDENSLKLVFKGIRKRRVISVLFWVSLVFLGMLTVFARMVKPNYISYQESGVTIVESGNGDIYAHFSDNVTSCMVNRSMDPDNQSVVEIEAWTCLWDEIIGKTTPSVRIASKEDPIHIAYYFDFTKENGNVTVLYGTDTEIAAVLPRLVLGYYLILALIATGMLGIACLVFRKDKKLGRICRYLVAAPISYMTSYLFIPTGFATFSINLDFILLCIATLAIYGILIFGAFMLRQYRQDREIE